MTRINVGISPSELCDQHLVAEYRELPRLWNMTPKSKAPPRFKLGAGHVLWCLQDPGMLADRYRGLVSEMRRRGMAVNFPDPPVTDGARPTAEELEEAAILVRERLTERMVTMKRVPKWTAPTN